MAIGLGSIGGALATGMYVYRRRGNSLLALVQYLLNLRILLDLATAWLLGRLVTELLTGLLVEDGSSLPVWLSLIWLAVFVGYFVFSYWLFGGTLWQHILKTRRRPGTES